MPWMERDTVSLRREFVTLALSAEANTALLCRRFGISRKTGYKWLARFAEEGAPGLLDRSRRPRASPTRTEPGVEALVVAVRRDQARWRPRRTSANAQSHGIEAN